MKEQRAKEPRMKAQGRAKRRANARSLLGCLLALLLGGGFIPQAQAAEVTFDLDTEPLVLAEEIFGTLPPTQVLGGTNQPTIILRFNSGILRTGGQRGGLITYRLGDGAQFGQTLPKVPATSWRHLNAEGKDVTSDGMYEFVIEVNARDPINSEDPQVQRGEQGESSVRLLVRKQGGLAEEDVTGQAFALRLPGLRNLENLRDGDTVRVGRILTAPGYLGANSFFTTINPLTDGVGGNTITSDLLVQVVNAVQLSATSASTLSFTADENMPSRLPSSAATVVEITDANSNTRQGIDLGSLGLVLGTTAQQADGTAFALTADDTLTISITATEGFGANTIAFIDLNGNMTADDNELIDLSADLSTAMRELAGDGDAVAALASAARNVYLAPDGNTRLITSEYTLGMALDYATATHLDETPVAADTVTITGIEVPVERDVEFRLDTGASQLLAQELFSARSEALAITGERSITLTVLEGSGVSELATATLEYRLDDGLQFGANLDSDSLVTGALSNSNSQIFTTLMAGGQQGDSSVTYQVVTSPTGGDPALAEGDELLLTLPALQVVGSPAHGAELGVQLFIAPENIVDDFNFQELNPLTDGEDGNSIMNSVLVEVRNVITLTATNEVASAAASGTMPRQFDGTGNPDGVFTIALADGTTRTVARLGLVQLASANFGDGGAAIKTEDGATDFALTEDDNVRIRLNGPRLADYALAFIDTDGNGTVEENEELSLSTSTSLPASVITELLEEDIARPVYLVPDGVRNIITGSYSVTVTVDYADAGYEDETAMTDALSVMGLAAVERNAEFQLETTAGLLALEIFGTRQEVLELPGERRIVLRVLEASGVTRGGTGLIEYRLDDGLQFGVRALRSTDLRLVRGEDNPTSDALPELVSGGRLGDSSAVFRVRTGEPDRIDDAALAGGDELVLTLPGLQNFGTPKDGSEFKVRVVVEPVVATGGFNFPLLNPLAAGMEDSDTLIRVGREFTLNSAASGSLPMVDADNRARFASGALSFSLPDGGTGQAIALGSLGVTRAEPDYKGEDGVTDFALTAADRFLVTLLGDNFPAGALAFIDLDGDISLDTGEAVSLPGGLALSGTGRGGEALLAEPRTVYLVTDGEALLEPGNYAAELTLDFANAGYLDDSEPTPTLAIAIEGIRRRAFAYAVPNCTQVERGSIHLINETNLPLTVFVSGRDQAGTNLGMVELDASLVRGGGLPELQPEESLDLLTEQLEQLFSLNDGGFVRGNLCTVEDTWHGRAQLAFFANGNLTIVPQIRGSLGELRDIGGFSGLSVGEERVGR